VDRTTRVQNLRSHLVTTPLLRQFRGTLGRLDMQYAHRPIHARLTVIRPKDTNEDYALNFAVNDTKVDIVQ